MRPVEGSRKALAFGLAQENAIYVVYVTQGGFSVVPRDYRTLTAGRRREWILIGTSLANAKLVYINRAVTLAP